MNKKILILILLLLINYHSFAHDREINTMHELWSNLWKNKETGWEQKQPNALLQNYLNLLNLKPASRIFVPLSGKSIDMAWLAKQGYYIVGVELNVDACELFFKENNIPYKKSKEGKFDIFKSDKITLISGDYFELDKKLLGKVDAVYDRAALIALPFETRQAYIKKMLNLIDNHTQMLLITFVYNEHAIQGPPYSVNKEETQKHFGNKFNIIALYDEIVPIPEHLSKKGLKNLRELAFHLTPIKS